MPPSPHFCEADIGEHGGKIAHRRQDVLAPDDPGHRLDMQRMHCEHRRRKPRAGHPQPPQQPPQQQHDPGMQQQIDQVIAERRQPPQFMLQPEGGIQQRPVMDFVWQQRTRGKPDLRQPRPDVKRRDLGQYIVIPDDPADSAGK